MPLEADSRRNGGGSDVADVSEGEGTGSDLNVLDEKEAQESYTALPTVVNDETAALENSGEAKASSPPSVRWTKRKRVLAIAPLTMAVLVALLVSALLHTRKRTGEAGLVPKRKPKAELIPAWTPVRQPQAPQRKKGVVEIERRKPARQPSPTEEPAPIVLPKYVDEILPGMMPLRLDAESMALYADELRHAAAQLQNAWDSATESVKEVFVFNYMPAVSEDLALPLEPMAYVEAFAPVRPTGSPEVWAPTDVAKYNHAVNTILSTTVTRAMTNRLLFLSELENYCDRSRAGSWLLRLTRRQLPPEDILADATDLVDFKEFLSMLEGPLATEFKEEDAATDEKIPRILAEHLASHMVGEALRLESDRYVHGLFEEFLVALQTDDIVLTDGQGIPFPVAAFARKLRIFTEQREVDVLQPEDIDEWGTSWTLKKMLYRLNVRVVADERRHNETVKSEIPDVFIPSLLGLALGLL